MYLLFESFNVNINSFGTYNAFIILVYLFILFSVISFFVQTHRILLMSLLLNIMMIGYLFVFLLLVNTKSEDLVYIYSKQLYIIFLIFSWITVLVTEVISKKKRLIATLITFLFGLAILVILFGSDYLMITHRVHYGTYPSAVKGPYFFVFQLYVLFISIYIVTDFIMIFRKDRELFKEVWLIYSAIIFYAFYTNILSYVINHVDYIKPSLYVDSLVYAVLLLIFVFGKVRQNIKEHEQYYDSYLYDELTGVYTRSYILEVLDERIEHIHFEDDYVALIDIDYFKKINDIYGHHTGDEVLRIIGRLLTQLSKESSYCGRLGGDEFLLVFVRVTKEKVLSLLEKLEADYQEEIQKLNPSLLKTQTGLSIGVLAFNNSMTSTDVLSQVDQLMYQEKGKSRSS